MNIVIFLISIINGFGQEGPWRYRPTESKHTLLIDSRTAIDVSDYSGEGILGVFLDSLGIDVCVGYVNLSLSSASLVANRESNDSNSSVGERFRFKLWDREKECIYDSVTVAYSTSDKAPNGGIFINDGVSYISSIRASGIKIDYPTSLICTNSNQVSAIVDPGKYRFKFSAEDGLRIEANTGTIDAANSKPGIYTIKLASEYCMSNSTHEVRVSNAEMELKERQYKCEGELLDVATLSVEATDSWEIADSAGSKEFLAVGQHNLRFVNTDGCVVERRVEVVDYPVQEIQFEKEFNCESTTIRLVKNQNLKAVEWPNDATGNAMEVFEGANIELNYTDSNQCRYSKSINVEIKKLEIESLETRMVPADCYLKGGIEIKGVNIKNNIGELHYEFVNQLTNETFFEPNQLAEGKYQIHVFDERNCLDTWAEDLIVVKDCLNDRPIFSPNSDNVDDKYYISDEGMAEVYNRNGTKVGEFETPIYWDGTNQQGQKLPMGTYLIVINKEKVINITILR